MFVIGGGPRFHGGVCGYHPNIVALAWDDDGNTEYRQDANGDYRSTDFRDAYGTVFKHWLNMPAGAIVWACCRSTPVRRPLTGRRRTSTCRFSRSACRRPARGQ